MGKRKREMSTGFVEALKEAFPVLPCPSVKEIIFNNCPCESCAFVRASLGGLRWDQISKEVIQKLKLDLSHLSIAGFRYYIPAYLHLAYETAETGLLGLVDWIVFSFDPAVHSPKEFTSEQRQVIFRFLNWAGTRLRNEDAKRYAEFWKQA